MAISEAFFRSETSQKVTHRRDVEIVLDVLEMRQGVLFDLTFYSRFAVRTFEVMQRVGTKGDGFGRMQQSFSDAVQRVRTILAEIDQQDFPNRTRYISVDAASFHELISLAQDFALVKDWMLDTNTNLRTLRSGGDREIDHK